MESQARICEECRRNRNLERLRREPSYLMLKQFDAGYQFAKRREAALSQEAIEKCCSYLEKKLQEQQENI